MPRETIVNEIHIDTKAQDLLAMENLIKNHVEGIQKLKIELKKTREMFDDSFNTSPTYREHNEKVKEVTKGKNSVRAEILKQPAVAKLSQQVKDIRFDLTEKEKTLADLLLDYKEQTQATQLSLLDGTEMEIVLTAKLVRRSK